MSAAPAVCPPNFIPLVVELVSQSKTAPVAQSAKSAALPVDAMVTYSISVPANVPLVLAPVDTALVKSAPPAVLCGQQAVGHRAHGLVRRRIGGPTWLGTTSCAANRSSSPGM